MKLTGKIQSKTNNSVKINNFWIKFFKTELLQGFIAGELKARKELIEEIRKSKVMVEGKRDQNKWWRKIEDKLKELEKKQ